MPPVIRNIHIKNFRGFQDFRLEGLNQLTILTGRNGCGKSTVLDALMIGAAPDFLTAVGTVVQRHPQSKDGSRWLFNKPQEPVDLLVYSSPGESMRRLRFSGSLDSEAQKLSELMTALGSAKPFRKISAFNLKYDQRTNEFSQFHHGTLVFDLEGRHELKRLERPTGPVSAARLIDPALFQDLSRSLSKAIQEGNRTRLQDFLKPVLPELLSIQILTEDDGSSNIYLEWPSGAVPLSFSGDGIAAMLQIAIEAVRVEKDGLILIEEPEVFLHPKGISVVAGLLLELMREGRQVVVTTHSLELIDSLLGRSDELDRARMSLINLRPQDGSPKVVAWSGREFDYIREKIGEDLR